jgi:hypothetical protein
MLHRIAQFAGGSQHRVASLSFFEGSKMMCAWRRKLDHVVEAVEPQTLQ